MYRFIDLNGKRTDLDMALKTGLLSDPKYIPSSFIYDAEGSRLFERICDLPEYYLTNKEMEILAAHAGQIGAMLASDGTLVELGSGNSQKTRLLIESCLSRQTTLCYVPVDISREMLTQASRDLYHSYSDLSVTACCGDYLDGLDYLTGLPGRKVVAWMGSSIGNFDKPTAARFLKKIKSLLNAGDAILIGIDLRKDTELLEKAYNDADGITSRYHLNCLDRFNAEYGANFDKRRFYHRSVYDETSGSINAFIISRCSQKIDVADLGVTCTLGADEKIFNERSCKYDQEEILWLARQANVTLAAQWLDGEGYYSLNLFR